MLNKNGERELAYVVKIDAIEPIVGSDNCEAAIVGGWRVMVRKGTFEPNDLAIYFEIDSKVDTTKPEFAFLENKGGKIKTQRYTFGGKGLMISQGLLMAPEDFGWKFIKDSAYAGEPCIVKDFAKTNVIFATGESRFLTKELGVTYAEEEDNVRKAESTDKYKKMAGRHPNLFKKPWARWMMKREWGRKIMFFFFGKKKDKKNTWPSWVVKTDEDRIQNQPWILNDKSPWIATEKIDGSSTTFTMKRGKKRLFGQDKNEFYVCSRNVVFDKPDKKCFYPTNIYTEMAEKYKVESVLATYLESHPDVEWVTIQGETYGEGVQKRDYSLKGHDFMAFNLIDSVRGRWNSVEAKNVCSTYGIPWVPILDENFILPDTVDELLTIATGESVCDHGMREGLVFRSQDGVKSFKAVSNEFLLKYHNG